MTRTLLFICLFLTSTLLHADDQVFYPDRQKNLISFIYSNYQTKNFWNEEGKKLPSYNEFHQHAYQGLIQYCFNFEHAFFAQGGYRWIEEELNGRTLGLEDCLLGYRYTLPCSPWSAQLIAILPVGPHKSSLRYGSYGTEVALFYSQLFNIRGERAFVDTKLGYRKYWDFPADQMRGHLHLGWWPCDCFYLLAGAECVCGLNNGDELFTENFIVFHSNYRLVKALFMGSLTLYSHIGLAVGYEQYIWGHQVGTGRELFAQLSCYF